MKSWKGSEMGRDQSPMGSRSGDKNGQLYKLDIIILIYGGGHGDLNDFLKCLNQVKIKVF